MDKSFPTTSLDHAHGFQTPNQQILAPKSTISMPFDLSNAIILSREIVIIPTKIKIIQNKIIVQTSVLRQNGSMFLIPSNYLNIFNLNYKSNDNTQFRIREFSDCFTVDLLIKVDALTFVEAEHQIYLNIQQSVEKYRLFLIMLGYIKASSRFTLKLKSLTIRLKKQIVSCIKQRKDKSELSSQQVNNGLETNVTTVSQIAVKNFNNNGDDCGKVKIFKRGGYFNIDRKQCRVTLLDGSQFDEQLALKKIRRSGQKQSLKQAQEQSKEKLDYQLKVISKIKYNKYLVNYYKPPRDFFFGMQFIEKSLKDVIYGKEVLNVKQIFSLAKQLVSAVSSIHKTGVVHRDLKPDNILVEKRKGQQLQLKIIDFGESVIIQEYEREKERRKFGCTPPYSPFECVLDCPDGCNKKQIDLWSVCMIIYELVFRERAIYYNKSICEIVLQEQPQLFDYRPVLSHRPLGGVRKIEELTYLLTEQNLRLNQSERVGLVGIFEYIKAMQIFYDATIKQFQEFLAVLL